MGDAARRAATDVAAAERPLLLRVRKPGSPRSGAGAPSPGPQAASLGNDSSADGAGSTHRGSALASAAGSRLNSESGAGPFAGCGPRLVSPVPARFALCGSRKRNRVPAKSQLGRGAARLRRAPLRGVIRRDMLLQSVSIGTQGTNGTQGTQGPRVSGAHSVGSVTLIESRLDRVASRRHKRRTLGAPPATCRPP